MSSHHEMLKMTSPPGARTQINGREVDYFCGTGYYALQNHPAMIVAAQQALTEYGVGVATSRAGFADHPLLLEVEAKAADFFETERALYYISGYFGSAVLLTGLTDQYDMIFVDEQSHYSVFDGAALTRKPVTTFAHCDAQDLAAKLYTHCKSGQRPLVITDGVFPASGAMPPLRDYHELLNQIEGALLCVDDAHATGVLGEKGQGTLEYYGISGPNCFSSGTLSKALGGHGGIIAGSRNLIDDLQHSRVISGSSCVPIAAAAASAKAFDLLKSQPALRQSLWCNVAYAKNAFRQLGFTGLPDTPVPILCLQGQDLHLEFIQARLFERGIATLFMPEGGYSSVPKGGAIRIAIFSSHTHEQIDHLAHEVNRCL